MRAPSVNGLARLVFMPEDKRVKRFAPIGDSPDGELYQRLSNVGGFESLYQEGKSTENSPQHQTGGPAIRNARGRGCRHNRFVTMKEPRPLGLANAFCRD